MSHTRASSKRTRRSLSGTQATANRATTGTPKSKSAQKPKGTQRPKGTQKPNRGLPLPMKRMVRALFGKTANKKRDGDTITSQKMFLAGGSIATLALLAIVPGKGTSQAIAQANCQQVIKSGAEISRSQLASLLSMPEGASTEAVRQVISEPYCLLPVPDEKQSSVEQQSSQSEAKKATTREAYPLAFDPEAWVVVNYSAGTYVDYDFVFKR